MIHAYKYNGWLYRTWEFPIIIYDCADYIVLASNATSILTSEYNTTRFFNSQNNNQLFWVFFKHEWFNLLISIIDDKVQYYVNLASIFLYEESAIKYYDFELDFKIFNNGHWTELDQDEFIEAIGRYHYSNQLITVIREAEKKLIGLINEEYFTKEFNTIKLLDFIQLFNKYRSDKDRNE